MSVACVMAALVAAGVRINSTASFPVGLYWAVDAPPAKGELVMFCPPPQRVFDVAKQRGYIGPGFCPGGYGYLIKKIVAAQNDVMVMTEEGVIVDGERLPNSKPIAMDPAGRALPQLRVRDYTLSSTDVLLMSDYSPRSFDGRYFGVIDKHNIRNVVRPILTW